MEASQDGDAPPPLPEKRRSGGASVLDSLTSSTASSTTPTQSPYSSMCLEGGGGGLSPSASPLSHSPSSSVGSGLNHSTEDLLSSGTSGSSTTVARTQSDSRIASMSAQTSRSQKTCEEINELTQRIRDMTTSIEDTPPPLPTKRNLMRLHSQYDNVPPDGLSSASSSMGGMASLVSASSLTSMSSRTVVTRTHESRISTASSSSSQSSHSFMSSQSVQSGKAWQNTMLAFGPGGGCTSTERASSHETYSSSETFSSTASHSSTESLPKPPPLPPKKRHIQAYMQTFGALTQPISLDSISRHSINFYEAQWHQHQMELFQPLYPRSNTISVISDISSFSSDASFSSGSPERFSADSFMQGIPSLPVKTRRAINRQSHMSNESSQSDMSGGEPTVDKTQSLVEPLSMPLIIPEFSELKRSSAPAQVVTSMSPPTPPPPLPSPTKSEIQRDADSDFAELNPLDDVDVSDQLIRKRPGEEGPDIRGGSVDALIVHATSAGNSGLESDENNTEEFIYQEAFLTTYRTFIVPKGLMEKLLYRFYKFQHAKDSKKRLAMNAFSLLIRVIDELGFTELDGDAQQRMMDLVYELLCQGELTLAKVLRKKLLDKRKQQLDAHDQSQSFQSVTLQPAHSQDLLHFKSHEIAENMTLMDAALFQKIEIPEVLLWAKEQSEELSPNLTHFTEHFNKMSYWCRTQILTQEDGKEREKFLMKFIKIMRHLRKLHNFNSYLAILSALDSAPVRRLEWQKQNLEALKEFCHLIDSSSSFRAYRKALAETEPPCIPYLGLILQDLTFINIGNQDNLPDGSVNFAKRWQQFNILDSMRRFKTCSYNALKPNPKLVTVLQNFDHYLSEEQLWQISETIKPRGGRKKVEAS